MPAAATTSTSPPVLMPPISDATTPVCPPGCNGVTNLETYNVVPAPSIATWRGFGPTARDATCVPVLASSFSTRPLPSSTTKALLATGEKTTPNGCDAYGSVTVCTTARLDGL